MPSLPVICASAALVGTAPRTPPEPPLAPELEVRDALEGVVGSVESEHFSYRWGADAVPSESQQTLVLEVLEAAWEDQFEVLGFPPPPGSSAYRFNVYENSDALTANGQTLPTGIGSGYVYIDPAGWPNLIIDPGAWATDADLVDQDLDAPGVFITHVLTHELQHASQLSSLAWTGFENFWFNENMSEWVAWRAQPGDYSAGVSVQGHVAAPQLAWEWSDIGVYTGGAANQEVFHFYGGYPLLLVLSERFGPSFVVDWTTDDADSPLPLDRLDAMLAEEGAATPDLLAEAWGRMRTGDFDDAEHLASWFDLAVDDPDAFPDAHPFAGTLDPDGAWQVPEDDVAWPQRYGMHRWRLDAPPPELEVRLDGASQGSSGTPTGWRVVAVTQTAGEHAWSLLEPPALLDLDDVDALELLVVPAADAYIEDETFDYQIAVGPAAQACGCALVQRSSPLIALLFIPLLFMRRQPSPRS